MALIESFHKILTNFPKDYIRLAFAYGSGVFQQKGHADMSKNMVDFIFVVDKPASFHRENLVMNESHYSFLKVFGPKSIANVQEKLGAKIYFNTLVAVEDRVVKYGVISTNSLINDLLDWETLYVSGRLHKPVNVLIHNEVSDLSAALITNHQSAVHTALLLLPETFSEQELFHTIANLSYSGDFRMTVGEDKNKVTNIVTPHMDRFTRIYEAILENEQHLYWSRSQGLLEQSLSASTKLHHLNLLPKMVQFGLISGRSRDGRFHDAEDVIRGLAHDTGCAELVQDSVANIVKRSSMTQSLKGILTAGISKSVKYSYNKLVKMMNSKK